MKKTSILEAFTKGLKEIPSSLFRFIAKLFTNGYLYFVSSLPTLLISFVIMAIVKGLSQDSYAAAMAFKIIFTIGQIIPLAMSIYMSEWELASTNENSSELCYAICAAIIAYVWIKF